MESKEQLAPAEEICLVMKKIYDRNLTSLTGGNLSVLDENGDMWVSPSGIDKGTLKKEDIVKVFSDETYEGIHKPTSEFRIHKRILDTIPGMKAVLHAHAPAMVAMSIAYQVPVTQLLLAAKELCDNPGMAEYATPGSLELVDEVGKTFQQGYQAAVLKNHSVFVGSQLGLRDGYSILEQLETTSKSMMLARFLGEPQLLTEAEWDQYKENRSQARKEAGGCSEEDQVKPEEKLEEKLGEELASKKAELALFINRAYEKGLFSNGYGAMSLRVDDKTFVISPDRKHNAFGDRDTVVIHEGKILGDVLPDQDFALHQRIYESQPEVNCIMLAAPAYLSAYAMTGLPYEVDIAPESYGVLREDYRPGFADFLHMDVLAQEMSLVRPFAIIPHVGALALGPNATLTFDKMEVAEFSAESLILTRLADYPIYPLTKEQLYLSDQH